MSDRVEGARIAALRREQSWSQEELAQASGLSVRTVQRFESGEAASLDTKRALAAAFDVDVRTFAAAKPLPRGFRWGVIASAAGTVIGVGFAPWAIWQGTRAGTVPNDEAGIYFGTLNAFLGLGLAGPGWLRNSRRNASIPSSNLETARLRRTAGTPGRGCLSESGSRRMRRSCASRAGPGRV